MTSKKKTINYRLAVVIDIDNPTKQLNLEAAFCQAVDKIYKDANASENPFVLKTGINGIEIAMDTVKKYKRPFKREGCTCGWIVRYSTNTKFPLVDPNEQDSDASIFETLGEPKDEKGIKRNLQESFVVFAIKENHIAYMASDMHGLRTLENYLKWLIQDESDTIHNLGLSFNHVEIDSVKEKLKESPIKSLKLSCAPHKETEIHENSRNKKITKNGVTRKLFKTIYTMFSRGDDESKESMTEIEKEADRIYTDDIFMEITIATKARSKDAPFATIASLADALDTNEEISIEAIQKNGGRIYHSELIIKDEISVQMSGNEMIKDDGMSASASWLTDSIKDGKIPVL